MNPQDLLDYHFGQLTHARQIQLEAEFAKKPELAERSQRLGDSIRNLVDDGESYDPPADLAARTLAFVDSTQHASRKIDWAPRRVNFRMADLAVAATIFLAGLATLVPAISRMKAQVMVTQCVDNLRRLGTVLGSYANSTGHFPFFGGTNGQKPEMPEMLDQAGLDCSVMACPTKQGGFQLASLRDVSPLARWVEQRRPDWRRGLENGYAFNVGYLESPGKPSPIPANTSEIFPLVADPPPLDSMLRLTSGNSPNHGGSGQNVLFSDLHVRWLKNRRLPGDDDIYQNASSRRGYGLHKNDATLLPLVVPMD